MTIVSHIDKYNVLAKYVIDHDIEDCEFKDKVHVIESNLLIMENVIEGLEWIFEDLSSNWLNITLIKNLSILDV